MQIPLDKAFKFGAGRYIQLPGAIDEAGSEAAALGKKAFIICGRTAFDIAGSPLEASLSRAGVEYGTAVCGGYTTHEKSKALAAQAMDGGYDLIIGLGGGKIMDLAKAAAHYSSLPVINVPTQASTCAAYTPMSVMYTEEGKTDGNFYHSREVSAVIVDEDIMVRQPPRYAASGMLDAMSKFIEIQNAHDEMNFSDFTIEVFTAFELSRYLYGILESTCLKVYDDIKNHVLSREVHDFLFINFAVTGMVSGISKAFGQSALAHEMYYAARTFFTHEAADYMHGEIVGMALIMQLCYNKTPEKVPALKDTMRRMGMPLYLSDIGIAETDENLEKLVGHMMSTTFYEETPENRARLYGAVRAMCRDAEQ